MSGIHVSQQLQEMIGEGYTEKKETTYVIYRVKFSNGREKLYASQDTAESFAEHMEANETIMSEVKIHRRIFMPFSVASKRNDEAALAKYLEQQAAQEQPSC